MDAGAAACCKRLDNFQSRCLFRIRPRLLKGWDQYSDPSEEVRRASRTHAHYHYSCALVLAP